MSKSRYLTEFEIGKITAYCEHGWSGTQISNKLGRHKSTIYRYLQNQQNYGKKKRTGRIPILTNRGKRSIFRAASSGKMSAGQIKNSQKIRLTTRRVQQILKSSPNLKYEKGKPRSRITDKHKKARLNWAKDKITWGVKWRKSCFVMKRSLI